jgi:putative redox protein
MQATVTWDHGLTFAGTADSGFTVDLGGAVSAGGDDDGFRPMELILVGLIGCTAMDVISILQKKRQQVTGFTVRATAERADEHPKVFTRAVIEYVVTGHDIDSKAVERALELSEQRYCPAQAMLGQVFPIELKYEIVAV